MPEGPLALKGALGRVKGNYTLDEGLLLKTFNKADTDQSGEIDRSELHALVKSLGFELTETDLAIYSRKTFDKYDKDRSGSISLREFRAFFSTVLADKKALEKHKLVIEHKFKKHTLVSNARKAFEAADTNKSGTIDRAELDPVLQSLGLALSPAQIKDFVDHAFQTADKDGSDVLDLDEFTYLFECCLADDAVRHKYSQKIERRYRERASEIEALFTLMDCDESGDVSCTELVDTLTYVGFDDDDVREMFHRYDRDSDGRISLDEFMDMFYTEDLKKPTAGLLG
mmetsp:Transcript_58196/g.137194  ORF Transcript_58196/g.137194 Transcript_58196/m.137194 type:complete len:285 (+) Transcript_58196:2-856(+)